MPGTTRIIPLGGLGGVGKNMTVYEADGEVVVVDAGLAFPRDEHLGVDLILPDFSYLSDLDRPVRAILLTQPPAAPRAARFCSRTGPRAPGAPCRTGSVRPGCRRSGRPV